MGLGLKKAFGLAIAFNGTKVIGQMEVSSSVTSLLGLEDDDDGVSFLKIESWCKVNESHWW